ncbi:glycosyltransferase [Candidatus Woesearchaeota archaeon]|jgi:glycosyltransferase involved in cell wall biosynthesis|nr:glycosyltransferase [Candidatus Woesearchaeota archaeon]
MKEPLVSVIMNCYNGSQFLRESINSVYAQTYNNWEIIFWDNGSTDNSSEIAQSYGHKLKYFLSKKNTNLGIAREMAIRQASGDYIAFLDCDDFWYKNKLALQIPLFQDSSVGLVYSNYWIKNKKIKKISSRVKLPFGYILDKLLHSYSVGFLTVIIRRDAISNKDVFFDTRYNIIHDFDLIINISINWKFACVQDPLACYRYHEKNETIKKIDEYIKELEFWINENESNLGISLQKSFYRKKDMLLYLKGKEMVKKGNRVAALFYLYKISFCMEKFKLFVIIVLPKYMVN